jgi:hypothetical protein
MKSFWECETSEPFFQKGFCPPEAKVTVNLGLKEGLTI